MFLTGCPSTDLCQDVIDQPDLDFEIFEKYGGVGAKPDLTSDYLIVMQHPVTTEFGDARTQAMQTLKAVHALSQPTLWFWPNIDAGSDDTSKAIRVFRETHDPGNIHFFRNMEPQDFLRVLNRAKVIIGNSSAGIRESAYLGVPSVNIGSRQAGRERGPNVIDVPYDAAAIQNAIQNHLQAPRPASSNLYGQGQAGTMMADILALTLAEMDKRDGIVRADVRVATPLSEGESRAVHDTLSAHAGSSVDMQVTVDPAIMGGMIVRIG